MVAGECLPLDLQKVAEEVAHHDGPVWTDIISLRREDAARLGYDCGAAWRNLLRGRASTIAKCMKIPPEDLRWYAAFHNEGHHPHVHLITYSVGKEPYLSKQGIRDMKSALANEIFKQDLLQIYEAQTQYRDSLSQSSRDKIQKIVEEINRGEYRNEKVETMIRLLSQQLRNAKGKKVYGYLPQPARDLVNNIIDELGKDGRIAELYGLWYQQRDAVVHTYQDSAEERIPLSQNKTFHPIRNIIVSEVLKLSDEVPILADNVEIVLGDAEELAPMQEPPLPFPEPPPPAPAPVDNEPLDEVPDVEKVQGTDTPPLSINTPVRGKQNFWWSKEYKHARQYLYGTKDTPPDLTTAYEHMLVLAEAGNGLAMHDLGKMLLTGQGCEADEAQAQVWFAKAHTAFLAMAQSDKNPHYWQYRIGKMYAYGYGVEQDDALSAQWFEKAVEGGNPFAAYALGGQYDRGKGVEQDHGKAFQLFTIAATDEKSPNAYAQYQLGRMCKDGIGMEVNMKSSAQWYRQAYLGFLAQEQIMVDDRLLYRLGSMELTGTGTDVDLEKAQEHFEKAAEQNNADALYGLGKLYLREDYTGYDSQTAVEHLTQAAERDHVHAQYLLGKLLLRGDAVAQDISGGLHWLEKAVAQGDIYAAYTLGKACLLGESLHQDIPRAIQLLTTAATAGNQYAQYTLGKMLLYGQHVPLDVEAGKEYLRAAAAQGNAYAQHLLDNYGIVPIRNASVRLLGALARMLQEDIQREQDQKAKLRVDRKQLQKIAEKKQAQGLRLG